MVMNPCLKKEEGLRNRADKLLVRTEELCTLQRSGPGFLCIYEKFPHITNTTVPLKELEIDVVRKHALSRC